MTKKGPWSSHQIERFLEDVRIPMQIACNAGSGHPVLASLWFLQHEGKLWCATQQSASVVSLINRDPRCGFEISVETSPYRGVRGTGFATLHPERGEEILRTLIDRYLDETNSKLASLLLTHIDRETAIAIEPRTLVSWDFQRRMVPEA